MTTKHLFLVPTNLSIVEKLCELYKVGVRGTLMSILRVGTWHDAHIHLNLFLFLHI